MALTQYMTDEAFAWLLEELNYEGASKQKQLDIIRRAVGQMESELASKFVVPLVARTTGAYTDAPQFAQAQVESALKEKIKSIIGVDKNRAVSQGTSTEKFQDLHQREFERLIKSLLNWEVDYGFLLQNQAQEGKEPVQQLGLARSDISRDHSRRGGRY